MVTLSAQELIDAKPASTPQKSPGVADTTRVRGTSIIDDPTAVLEVRDRRRRAEGSMRFMPPMGHSWHPCCQYLLRISLAEGARWLRSAACPSQPWSPQTDGAPDGTATGKRWSTRSTSCSPTASPLPGPSRSLSGRACRCRRCSATSTGSTTCRSRPSRTTSRSTPSTSHCPTSVMARSPRPHRAPRVRPFRPVRTDRADRRPGPGSRLGSTSASASELAATRLEHADPLRTRHFAPELTLLDASTAADAEALSTCSPPSRVGSCSDRSTVATATTCAGRGPAVEGCPRPADHRAARCAAPTQSGLTGASTEPDNFFSSSE